MILLISTAGFNVLNINIGNMMMNTINIEYRQPFKHLSDDVRGYPNL